MREGEKVVEWEKVKREYIEDWEEIKEFKTRENYWRYYYQQQIIIKIFEYIKKYRHLSSVAEDEMTKIYYMADSFYPDILENLEKQREAFVEFLIRRILDLDILYPDIVDLCKSSGLTDAQTQTVVEWLVDYKFLKEKK